MDPGTIAVIGFCVFLAAWYGAGYWANHRRGRRLYAWLEEGLEVLGGEREMGWIGSPASGARINILHANSPFRRLEITLLLANREIPLLWLVDRLRLRPDRLIVKATLRSSHPGGIEASARKSWLPRDQEQSWITEEAAHGLTIAYQGAGAAKKVAGLQPWLSQYGASLHRLSWRNSDSHIQMQIGLAGLLKGSSGAFLTGLQAALGGNDAASDP